MYDEYFVYTVHCTAYYTKITLLNNLKLTVLLLIVNVSHLISRYLKLYQDLLIKYII